MDTKKLGSTISLADIKESVRQKQSIEFIAPADLLDLDNEDVQTYISRMGRVSLPPLNNKQELIKALFQMNPVSDSEKWDWINLLTPLNDGEISYQKIDDDYYLVTIMF